MVNLQFHHQPQALTMILLTARELTRAAPLLLEHNRNRLLLSIRPVPLHTSPSPGNVIIALRRIVRYRILTPCILETSRTAAPTDLEIGGWFAVENEAGVGLAFYAHVLFLGGVERSAFAVVGAVHK